MNTDRHETPRETPRVIRSTGIEVPGWPGPRPGGGYRGATEGLDTAVATAADFLANERGAEVEIRFNADRQSGGAFLADDSAGTLGITAGLYPDIPDEEHRALFADATASGDWDDLEERHRSAPKVLGFHVMAGARWLRDPSKATEGNPGSRYARPDFDTLPEAIAWFREHTLREPCPDEETRRRRWENLGEQIDTPNAEEPG